MQSLSILLVASFLLHISGFPDMSHTCPHQLYPNTVPSVNLSVSKYAENEILANSSHLFYFQNYNFLNSEKKIIFRLEPCRGVVYLYIRRTRPCWPDPWNDTWYHYKSVTNGSFDGTATIFEIPAESSQWFITVYSKVGGRYALTIVPEYYDYPRIPNGMIQAVQLARDTVEIAWEQAVSETPVSNYIIYSSIYFESESVPGQVLILNTVCGLQANTDHPYAVTSCVDQICKANITGLSNHRRYVFNVIAFNKMSNLQSVFAGILVKTVWDESGIDSLLEFTETAGIVIGTVTGVLVATFFFIIHKY